ncbi:MAG: nitroreductase family protein [Methylobacterium frigidaeris]
MTAMNERQRTLLARRYGGQPRPETMIWNDQIEHLLNHRSVRTFLTDPLPEGALETMVAAAQSASTSSALQQWSVVAVSGEQKRKVHDLIAATVPTDRIPWIADAPVVLLWVADLSRSSAIAAAQGDEPIVHDFLDAFLMASVDAALAAQNAAVAAEAVGLGVVFLGVMRNAANDLAALIDLPHHSFVTFGMAVGRPDPSRSSDMRPRLPQAVVLHHDRYVHDSHREHLPGYEDAYHAFRVRQGMGHKTWQEAVHMSATSMAYMSGRENLRETVVARGFKLR